MFREFPSIVFRKGLHWKDCLEYAHIYIQLEVLYSKFLNLGFLLQTLYQLAPEPGWTPQIDKI